MDKRNMAGLMSSDPIEELGEVYNEVQEIEQNFKKALGICQHLLKNCRDMFGKNQELSAECDQLKHEHQVMLNQNLVHSNVISRTEESMVKNAQNQQ